MRTERGITTQLSRYSWSSFSKGIEKILIQIQFKLFYKNFKTSYEKYNTDKIRFNSFISFK